MAVAMDSGTDRTSNLIGRSFRCGIAMSFPPTPQAKGRRRRLLLYRTGLFDDDDAQSLSQKFVVVVDAQQYRDGGDLTFETHLCRR
jgi:hypothetical protein